MADKPIRVAVIGGGCASVAAVWELSRPEHAGCYQVTLFQEGWRLGGKGASGRGAHGRIEEHGLHIWLGFYDNAFRMMRECHAELESQGAGSIFGDWRDAWVPENDSLWKRVVEDNKCEGLKVSEPVPIDVEAPDRCCLYRDFSRGIAEVVWSPLDDCYGSARLPLALLVSK